MEKLPVYTPLCSKLVNRFLTPQGASILLIVEKGRCCKYYVYHMQFSNYLYFSIFKENKNVHVCLPTKQTYFNNWSPYNCNCNSIMLEDTLRSGFIQIPDFNLPFNPPTLLYPLGPFLYPPGTCGNVQNVKNWRFLKTKL